mgnify:FL=1|jgi:hypothetical protein
MLDGWHKVDVNPYNSYNFNKVSFFTDEERAKSGAVKVLCT